MRMLRRIFLCFFLNAISFLASDPVAAFFHSRELVVRFLPFCPMAARQAALENQPSSIQAFPVLLPDFLSGLTPSTGAKASEKSDLHELLEGVGDEFLVGEGTNHAYRLFDSWAYELNFTCIGVVDGAIGRFHPHRFRDHPPWSDTSGRLAAEVMRLSEPPRLYAEFALVQLPRARTDKLAGPSFSLRPVFVLRQDEDADHARADLSVTVSIDHAGRRIGLATGLWRNVEMATPQVTTDQEAGYFSLPGISVEDSRRLPEKLALLHARAFAILSPTNSGLSTRIKEALATVFSDGFN